MQRCRKDTFLVSFSLEQIQCFGGPTPSLQSHYSPFITTTSWSVPPQCIGTFGLGVYPRTFSLSITGQVRMFCTKSLD